ncbi:MAG TPA: hypothetical protein PLR18_03405 [bacterium]|nr:hypothetical protein [bacterium]
MNNEDQQPITREILTDILKKEVIVPIGEKLDIMSGQISELQDKVGALQDHELEQDNRMSNMENSLRQEMTQVKDEILTSNDQLSKKMDKILVETVSHTASYKQHDVKLYDHEDRLKVLELKSA